MATKKQQEYDSLRTAQLKRHARQIAELANRHKTERHAMLLQHRAERQKLDELLTEPVKVADAPTRCRGCGQPSASTYTGDCRNCQTAPTLTVVPDA
jgi:hypothetical protein